MWSSYRFLGLLVLAIALVLLADAAMAQCAMCRATVESNAQNNSGSADKLNQGILYLMVLPYIIFAVVGTLWYRSSRKRKASRRALAAL